MNTNETDNNSGRPKRGQRQSAALSVDDSLNILGVALNHIYRAGLAIDTRNDDKSGALVIRITGAMQVTDNGQTAFVGRGSTEQ